MTKRLLALAALCVIAAALLIADFAYPAPSLDCGVSESFHVDENTAGLDLYWLTYLRLEDKTYRTIPLPPESIYSIGPGAMVVITEWRSQLSRTTIRYEARFDYDDECDNGSIPRQIPMGNSQAVPISQ